MPSEPGSPPIKSHTSIKVRNGPAVHASPGVWVAMMVVGALSCGREAAPVGAPPPPEVAVVTVGFEAVPLTYEFLGTVVPYRRVEVRARVEGLIQERGFTEGAFVTPGQLLYRIEPARYEAAFHAAQARVEAAQLQVSRYEPLLAQNAVSQQDMDNARSDLEAAQSALTQARRDFSDTDVKAEIAGRIGRTNLEVGARVSGSGDLLTTIDRLDPIYVTFRPSSDQLLTWRGSSASRALIRPGSGLVIEAILSDGSLLPRSGRLDFVAPALDSVTGTQEFRALFPNPDLQLVPGQFVRTRLVGFARDSALVVPVRAVQTALGRQFVYVVAQGDTVRTRDIKTGPWSGSSWIIEQGLSPGDRVVVDGIQKVFPGRPVRPVALADSAATSPARETTP